MDMENKMYRLATVVNTADVVDRLWGLADHFRRTEGRGSWQTETVLTTILHIMATERDLENAHARARSFKEELNYIITGEREDQ